MRARRHRPGVAASRVSGRAASATLIATVLAIGLVAGYVCTAAIRDGSSTSAHAPLSAGQPASAGCRHRGGQREAAHWRGVLLRLDDARMVAWSTGDTRMLDRVFAPGGSLLEQDRRDLGRYDARGLRMVGVRLAFGRPCVVSRSSRRVVLIVADRLGRVVAIAHDGVSRRLPSDNSSQHTIVLRRVSRGWRISAVRVVA